MAKKRKKGKTNYWSVAMWMLVFVGICWYWHHRGYSIFSSLLLGAVCLFCVLIVCAEVLCMYWDLKREQALSRTRSAPDLADFDTDDEPDCCALHPQGQWWDSSTGRWIDVVDEGSMNAPMSQRWNDDYGRWEDIPEEDEWAMMHPVGQEWNDLTGRWEDAGR